jgi:type IV pilus assembly protein PilW
MMSSVQRPSLRNSSPNRLTVQKGLTLVELLVALAISTIITIAAFSAMIVSRQGFSASDAASQLRDNSRFATDLLQRLGVQAGYVSDAFTTTVPLPNAPDPDPAITGFNSALADGSSPSTTFIARPSTTVDGSDVLVLRYQAAEAFAASGAVDNSMINCAGNPAPNTSVNREDWVVNVLHVAVAADGEPSLMCSLQNGNPQPIVRGVETFQVLYGVNGVTLTGEAPAVANTQNLPTRYLRADQLIVPGNVKLTNNNWRRVRSLKIGMVIRGPTGSAAENAAITYFPLGASPNANGDPGGSTVSSNDPGSAFTPVSDTRLRQVVNFTIHLRNFQDILP